jgi:hypothetical protein
MGINPHSIMIKYPSLAILAVMGVIPVHADVITPVQHFFGMGGQYPGYEDQDLSTPMGSLDRTPYSAADSDLGVQEILSPLPSRSPFIFDFSTAVYFTDNAPSINPPDSESSWLWSSRLIAAWRPHIASGWFADLGMTQEFLRFDSSSAQDYENSTFRVGTVKTFANFDELLFFARYEYQRLTGGSISDADYNAQRLRVGVQKVLFENDRNQISAGLNAAYELMAKPESLERESYGIELAHRYRLNDSFHTLASWRTTWYDFDSGGREDWAHSLGLELIWQICPSARAHLSVFFDQNDSNTPFGANDYESWTTGIGTGFTYTF